MQKTEAVREHLGKRLMLLTPGAFVVLLGVGVASFGAVSLGKLFSAPASAVALESSETPVGLWSISGSKLSQDDSVALLKEWSYTGTDNGQGNKGQNNGNQNGQGNGNGSGNGNDRNGVRVI